jgi:hypothetical protein
MKGLRISEEGRQSRAFYRLRREGVIHVTCHDQNLHPYSSAKKNFDAPTDQGAF